MGEITLDPASCEEANLRVRAAVYYTREMDGLRLPWFGKVWCNPPYSAGVIDQFVGALITNLEEIDQAIFLVNNATETKWGQQLLRVSSAACFLSGRVRY